MDLGQKGVFWFTDTLTSTQLVELAQRTEELGYAALWYPDVAGLRLLRTAGMGQIHQFTGAGPKGRDAPEAVIRHWNRRDTNGGRRKIARRLGNRQSTSRERP